MTERFLTSSERNWLKKSLANKIEERLPKVIEVLNNPLHRVLQKIDLELIILSENISEFRRLEASWRSEGSPCDKHCLIHIYTRLLLLFDFQ